MRENFGTVFKILFLLFDKGIIYEDFSFENFLRQNEIGKPRLNHAFLFDALGLCVFKVLICHFEIAELEIAECDLNVNVAES